MPSWSGRVSEIPGESAPEFAVSPTVPRSFRLDRYISEQLGLLSRSQIKTRSMEACLNGKAVKLSRIVKPGDSLELSWADPESTDLLPEDIPLGVIYEDSRVIVVDKAQGMVIHPGAGNHGGTLANALLFRRLQRQAGNQGGGIRPGIVHRLDKDTSGVMIAAWDDEALAFLADQFKRRCVRKTYAAIVQGVPKETSGRIETMISRDSRDRKRFAVSPNKGKSALTLYRVIRSWKGYSLMLLRPRTGRTHQLRVHMRYIGHPILGDPIYGFVDPLFPDAALMLHARSLSITLPGSESPVTFKAPLPDRFHLIIEKLNKI
ncbi:ribosomal large subunit pseudouridine synthase D [Spirochaetia bacterium]|nr:ribosomal large subunit pseudouridine synthase D [Spirochaetia bacterium]